MGGGGNLQIAGLHKGSVLEIAAEDGVANINDNSLSRLGVLQRAKKAAYQKTDLHSKRGTKTYNNACHVNI